ncbi:MAG: ferritin [candidate division Zixibacteria bacterium]|jgi:ferritin|nr:ferritin [candidate division Zixibacteria bacterium]
MMISKKMADRLNEQVNNEYYAFWIYQQMSFSFEDMGLTVFAKLFHKQAGEEREHAEKIAKYLVDQGAAVVLSAMNAPKTKYKSAEEIINGALEHEKKVTNDWNEISDMAVKEKDHATRVLADWFVEEQVEEVASMTELLGMVKLTQNPGQLLMLENRVYRMLEED